MLSVDNALHHHLMVYTLHVTALCRSFRHIPTLQKHSHTDLYTNTHNNQLLAMAKEKKSSCSLLQLTSPLPMQNTLRFGHCRSIPLSQRTFTAVVLRQIARQFPLPAVNSIKLLYQSVCTQQRAYGRQTLMHIYSTQKQVKTKRTYINNLNTLSYREGHQNKTQFLLKVSKSLHVSFAAMTRQTDRLSQRAGHDKIRKICLADIRKRTTIQTTMMMTTTTLKGSRFGPGSHVDAL